jgi:hypothetical protein
MLAELPMASAGMLKMLEMREGAARQAGQVIAVDGGFTTVRPLTEGRFQRDSGLRRMPHSRAQSIRVNVIGTRTRSRSRPPSLKRV